MDQQHLVGLQQGGRLGFAVAPDAVAAGVEDGRRLLVAHGKVEALRKGTLGRVAVVDLLGDVDLEGLPVARQRGDLDDLQPGDLAQPLQKSQVVVAFLPAAGKRGSSSNRRSKQRLMRMGYLIPALYKPPRPESQGPYVLSRRGRKFASPTLRIYEFIAFVFTWPSVFAITIP